MRIEMVPATGKHALWVALNMRKEDRAEAWASHGLRPLEALERSLWSLGPTTALLLDGEAAAMFGVGRTSLASPVGFPWMLGTNALVKNARRLLPESRRWVDEKRRGYALLTNFVDARNLSAVKWLKWLGFTVFPPEPYGWLNLPFHRFEMTGSSNVP